MNVEFVRRSGVVVGHAFVGWAVCGGIINVGRQVTSMEVTLRVHAVAVPVVFGLVAAHYFWRCAYTGPLTTATVFLAFAMAMDGLVVAPFAEHSYEMFSSVLGTWIPFGLIFAATFGVGSVMAQRSGDEALAGRAG